MNAIEKANKYVCQIETDHISDMAQDRAMWIRRAEGCGCLQCQKKARHYRKAWAEEFNRMYGRHEDQEEAWIVDWIFNNRLGGKHEEE